MSVRVLVMDAEQRAALAVTRSLGKAGFEVHTGSSRRWAVAAVSKWSHRHHALPDSLDSPAAFGVAAADLARRIGAAVVLPITDQSCLAVLQAEHLFKDRVLPLPSRNAFSAVSDKLHLARTAARYGIRVPQFQVLPDATLPVRSSLRFPMVVKPSRSVIIHEQGAFRTGVVLVRNEQDLSSVLSRLPPGAFPVMLQQRIIGRGVGVFLLLWDDELLAVFAHRRLREKPPGGGVSVYSESVEPPEGIVARVQRLLGDLSWRGVAMAEFKQEDGSGEPYLMEINGRFWGSLQLAIDAGVDFPALLVQAALGQRVTATTSWHAGQRLRWCLGDLDHFLTRALHSDADLWLPPGAPTRGQALRDLVLPWRSPGRSEVFRWSDPLPGVVEAVSWITSH